LAKSSTSCAECACRADSGLAATIYPSIGKRR
jgi:hypothetical protein